MSRYVYLDSDSFKHNLYRENTAFDFTSTIIQPFDFHNRDMWEVALTEIHFEPRNMPFSDDLYIMSDIVTRQTQVGRYYPEILRIVRSETVFNQPYYKNISRDHIDTIRIYIRKANNDVPDKGMLTSVRCVLHFQRKITSEY